MAPSVAIAERLEMRRQEKAAAAVADKAERVALLEVRERQRCEREEVAEWRLREEACQRREQEREAAERRAAEDAARAAHNEAIR